MVPTGAGSDIAVSVGSSTSCDRCFSTHPWAVLSQRWDRFLISASEIAKRMNPHNALSQLFWAFLVLILIAKHEWAIRPAMSRSEAYFFEATG
jgi:hypothetical protein